MTNESVSEYVGLAGLRAAMPALDELATAAGEPVTARPRWQEIWSRTYPQWEPWVLVLAGPDGRTAGAAAFARSRRGPLVRIVGLGHGTSDDARFPIADRQFAHSLATAIVARLAALRRPWALLVEQLPADCPVTDALAAMLPAAQVAEGQPMPMVVVEERDANRYLSRNARSAENKARNRLERAGHTVTERWVVDPDAVADAVPRLSAVHRARDEQLGRVSDHDDPARAAFFRDVLVDHAAAGELELFLLEVDGDLAAYVAAFRDGSALRVWDNRLSPRWSEFSAGRIANHAAIRRVVADPALDVLDWMRGDEPYKLSSANRIVATRQLEAWSSTAARMPYAAKDLLRAVRDRSPALDRAVRRVRINAGKHGKRLTANGT